MIDFGEEFKRELARNREIASRRVIDPEKIARERLIARCENAKTCCISDETLVNEFYANAVLTQAVRGKVCKSCRHVITSV